MRPGLSVIIPTNRDDAVLRGCLAALARQTLAPDVFEVIVVFNGAPRPASLAPADWPFALVLAELPQAHIGAAKNHAMRLARGEWIVLLNDDVRPLPDFLEQHRAVHCERDEPSLVLGASDWCVPDDDTVFDRLVRETSLVFFYDQMTPRRVYGFRHAWNLNLSLHRIWLEAEPFDERLGPFSYEDLEHAFRLEQRFGLRVWFDERPRLLHEHRYTLDGYLAREQRMGTMLPRLWHANPDCFRAIFRRDLDEDYIDECRQLVAAESPREAALRATLAAVVAQPATTLPNDAAAGRAWLNLVYQAHLPLKRLALRRGLLAAVDGDESPTNLTPRSAVEGAAT